MSFDVSPPSDCPLCPRLAAFRADNRALFPDFANAPVESFWGTLKTELVHHRRYQSRAEAEREITEYIDLFYNRQRRQARLGYLSPVAYTQLFRRQRAAA